MSDDDAQAGPMAAHLTDTLHRVARATPVGDRRADLLAVLDGPAAGPAPVIRVDGTGPSPRRGAALLAVAAVVLVVLALAAVAVVRSSPDDDQRPVDTAPSTTVAPGPFDDPALDTGWYLPGPGWEVVQAATDFLDRGERGACPCTGLVASEVGDGSTAIGIGEQGGLGPEDTPEDQFAPSRPIDVGGRTGTRQEYRQADGDPVVFVTVELETIGRRVVANSHGLDDATIVAIVDAWADRAEAGLEVRAADLPLPDGLVAGSPQTKTGTFEHLVVVTARNVETGVEVPYQVVPIGWLSGDLLFAEERTTTFDGQAFTVVVPSLGIVGRTGGPADVVVGGLPAITSLGDIDPADADALADGLHEVTAGEWRAALERLGEDADPDLLVAPTLFDEPLAG